MVTKGLRSFPRQASGIVLVKLAVLAGHVNFSDNTHRRASLAAVLRPAGVELATGWSAIDGALAEEERADPSVHDLTDRAAWVREHLTTLAHTIDRLHDQ